MKHPKFVSCFLSIRKDDEILLYCQDGKLRKIALIGNDKSCLKFWKKVGFAERCSEILCKKGFKNSIITYLYEGDEVDCLGRVTRA